MRVHSTADNLCSVSSLHPNTRIAQSAGQLPLDSRGFASGNVPQMHHRSRKHLQTSLEHAPCGPDACLVLIETLRGWIAAHADIHAVVIATPVREIEQDEVHVRAATALRDKTRGHLVCGGQPA